MGLFSTNGSGWSALGGVLGSAANMAYNSSQAESARDFTREIYQNRYQWQVADMRAAGLNPILAATNGMTNASNSALASSSENLGEAAANSASAKSVADMNQQYKKLAEMQGETEAAKQRNLDAKTAVEQLEADKARYTLLNGVEPSQARQLELNKQTVVSNLSLVNAQIQDMKHRQYYHGLTAQEEARLTRLQADQTELTSQAIAYGLPEKATESKIYDTPYLGTGMKALQEIGKAVFPYAHLWRGFYHLKR